MKEFSPANQMRINTWKNNIDGVDTEDDIEKHHKKIYDWIVKRYTNMNTKKSHLATLAVALRDVPKLAEAYKKYSIEATQLNDKVVAESKKQKVATNRKYVPFDEIIKAKDELKKNMKKTQRTHRKTKPIY